MGRQNGTGREYMDDIILQPNYNKTAAAIKATTNWFKQLERIGVPMDNVFTYNVFNSGVTRYSQVVWQRSDRIGCAVKSCSNSSVMMTFIGCQYKESGNWTNEKIYETGSSPCTKDTDCQCENCKCNATEALCITGFNTNARSLELAISWLSS